MSAVQPQYGPTLIGLLRSRSRAVRVAAGALALALAAAIVAIVLVTRADETVVLVRKPVTFNFAYGPQLERYAEPGARVALRRRAGGRLLESFVVRDLVLPPYRGAVGGMLPLWADGYMDRLRAAHRDYRFVSEGRTRINNGVGYSVTFRSTTGGRTLYVRHFLIVPELPDGQRRGVVLELKATFAAGTPNADSVGLYGQIKMPLRSFRFGEERTGGTS